ncbi:Xaa-Pro aminopeptidase [Nematocida homosporus]|uniref:Xaa-Pro aminopeptidase n=1 Tax=Nematocida homosporus TaxID=1912981 RepID=UPI002220B795|nr:Xaa-Pro aminopeptidase [Nematocida homosporus]KAI5184349.1 Xaa-Pro aminopeptidase [Nematocida homosporus]
MALEYIRKAMSEHGVDALLLHRRDPHLSEYLHDRYEHVAYFSGFTGSNAVLLVFPDSAYLYTDGRYFLQAKKQLLAGIELGKMGEYPSALERIIERGAKKVGVIMEYVTSQEIERVFGPHEQNFELVYLSEAFIAQLWPERPQIVAQELVGMETGRTFKEKLQLVKEAMVPSVGKPGRKRALEIVLVGDLDEIAWLTNWRGLDIPMSRLFYAFMWIEAKSEVVKVYTDAVVPKDLVGNIKVLPYAQFYEDILTIKDQHVGVTSNVNARIERTLHDNNEAVELFDEIAQLKAVKSDLEIQGFKEANIRDAAALCTLFGRIQARIEANDLVGEVEAAEMLLAIKQADSAFIVPSFETISGYGENGAIIHYTAESNDVKIGADNLYLIDSGSQYQMGTTDITRTVCFGQPTADQKKHYTALLKGHVSIERQRFPSKIPIGHLAPLVRQHVWALGLDYAHSTGHGVGFGLNVHESPPVLETAAKGQTKEGMVVTNEPGIYIEGAYGIRHENLMLVQSDQEAAGFFILKNITPVPIHHDLVDTSMLLPEELAHLNSWSQEVYKTVSPRLQSSPEGLQWLRYNTQPLATE